ncbi:DUF5787 family protein [Haloquadratum walsbyi]|uniref:DUF5787 family protein n=1 Tax=Haloquadratum walsbyi TaxID=293091 RepID=UPI00373AF08E
MPHASNQEEFAFELALCSYLETTTEWVLSRQLGAAAVNPGRRIIDICGVVPGSSFDTRSMITDERIPERAIAGPAGVGTSVRRSDAVDASPQTTKAVIEQALAADFFTIEHHNGYEHIRQTTRYPTEWFDRIIGIENKPDLKRPGELTRQLQVDISLGLFDAVILATKTHVTRAHLNRIPDAVGVWQFNPDTDNRTIIRQPAELATGTPGIELGSDQSDHTEIHPVSSKEKTRARRRIAERAYGKGWRNYTLPSCAHAETQPDGRPYCTEFDCVINPAQSCDTECPAHTHAEPPQYNKAKVRDARSPWNHDPPGARYRQSGLDRFK